MTNINLIERLAESAEDAIIDEFNRSVQLAAFVNQHNDPEAVSTIIRSIKVKALPTWPPEIEAKYEDELGHWYGGAELPKEVADMLQELIESSLEKWFRAGNPDKIANEVILSLG